MRKQNNDSAQQQENKKSKSQFRAKRPPLPKGANVQANAESRRVGETRKNKVGEYNTDSDNPKQSKIPRLTKAEDVKVPEPKKYTPGSEYNMQEQVQPEEKKTGIRRSQSYFENKPSLGSRNEPGNVKNL